MFLRNPTQIPGREFLGIVFDLKGRPPRKRQHTHHSGMSGKGLRGLFEIFVWFHGFLPVAESKH